MPILTTLMQNFFIQHGASRTYWIAFSGGLDSSVLLALCIAQQKQFNLRLAAIHINHQVSKNAVQWVANCQSICLQNNIQFIEKTVEIDNSNNEGFEAEARNKRYAALAACMQADDYLLTAHHQDDQAETLLLQLLRGAGPKGLAAMPALKSFAPGYHARPLLAMTRTVLMTYAKSQQLLWFDDESNTNIQFNRNYLRHEIMPLLQKRFPAATKAIARSAGHCADSQVLLEEYALSLLKNSKGKQEDTLSVSRLLTLSMPQQRLVLRAWVTACGYTLPDTNKLNAIRADVLHAAKDRHPCVTFGAGHQVRRFRDELILLPATVATAAKEDAYVWVPEQALALPGIGRLSAQFAAGVGLSVRLQQMKVGFRSGGEVAYISKRGHRSLKHLLQEWAVPVWQRQRIPLLFVENQLVCVVGYFIDVRFQAKEGEMGFIPHLDTSA